MKEPPKIRLVIVDLDNTLYDWIGFFVPSFYEMVHVASQILNADKEALLDELKTVHQKYRNSEQPFALLETDIVCAAYPGLDREKRAQLLDPAFHAFNKSRKELLKLFAGVKETLGAIKATKCAIAAHTEAVVSNSMFRLETLALTSEIERVYAPDSLGLSHPDGKQTYLASYGSHYLRLLPPDHRKPSPEVLLDIIRDYGVSPSETLYVGDSITRDIAMAKRAGAHAAWAKYGTKYDRSLWNKLVRVTHWTSEDIDREVRLRRETSGVLPDVELDSFAELMDHYIFRPQQSSPIPSA